MLALAGMVAASAAAAALMRRLTDFEAPASLAVKLSETTLSELSGGEGGGTTPLLVRFRLTKGEEAPFSLAVKLSESTFEASC